ncbi:hypothetical protein F5Y09DRAFT_327347 [Xylaria sp. FL1042]|nr:hypothetical protein F5Y09DRAFT_327347 [Xylaria sp. FL1042]
MPPNRRRFRAVNAALHGYFDVDTGYSRRCRKEIHRSINRWLNRSPYSVCTPQQTRLIINLLSGFAITHLEKWEDLGKLFMFLEACEVGVYPSLIAGVLKRIGADIASRNAWDTWSDYCALAGTVIETTPGHERFILRILVRVSTTMESRIIRHLRSRSWDMRNGTRLRIIPSDWQHWESVLTVFANNVWLTETERMSVDRAIELLRET